jgi:Uma2 family endonuclease
VSLIRRGATYEDLLLLFEEPVGEIVDGNLYTSPRPSIPHAVSASALGAALGGAFQLAPGGSGGWWILTQPELQLGDDILVADLAGWRRHRLPEPPETMAIDLAPDWACEIISPETETLDRAHKLAAHARAGVEYAWVVDPAARRLEVLRREAAGFIALGTFIDHAVVRAEPFAAIDLHLSSLWGEMRPPVAFRT